MEVIKRLVHKASFSREVAEVVASDLRAGVPNMEYMYPQGYICTSQGVHRGLE